MNFSNPFLNQNSRFNATVSVKINYIDLGIWLGHRYLPQA